MTENARRMGMKCYAARAEMPDDYYNALVDLLSRQFVREIENASVFGRAMQYAPTWVEKARLAELAHEEAEHCQAVGPVLEALGVDLSEAEKRWHLAGAFLGTPDEVTDWVEMVVYCCLIDRAGRIHVEALGGSSYLPYAATSEKIIREERGHEAYGEKEIVELTADPAVRARVERLFRKWLPRCIKLLGRPGSPQNQYCLRVGLKNQDSADEIAEYLQYVKGIADRCGIGFPARQELEAEGVELPAGLRWER
jgi:1,2-phenylacetyl-CoA epoxidase catalytic subunit